MDEGERGLVWAYSEPIFFNKPVSDLCAAWMTKTKMSRSTFFDKKRQLISKLIAAGVDVPLLGRLTLEQGNPD